MFKYVSLAAVVTTANVSCTQKSTLGKSEVPCMETVGDEFEVHYGYLESAGTVSLCAVNKKHDGFVGLGPASGMDDPDGIVVVGDTVDSTPRLKAWHVAKLRSSFAEANAFFSGQTHEVAHNARRICFTMPAAKLRGSVAQAHFVWRADTATALSSCVENGKLSQEWASITLNVKQSKQKNERRILQEANCETKSTLNKAEVPCMTVARENRLEIHFGRKGDEMSLCAVNIENEGWIGVGTTRRMSGSTAILAEGRSGALTERTVKLQSGDIAGEESEGLASGDITHTVADNKRSLCFSIHKSKLSGTPAEANFIWAVWRPDEEGSTVKAMHRSMEPISINFGVDETKPTESTKPPDDTSKPPDDTSKPPEDTPKPPGDTIACPESTLGDKKLACKVVSKVDKFALDYGYDKEAQTVSFCGTNMENDGWVGVGPGKSMDGPVVFLGDKETHGAYALERSKLGKAQPEFNDARTIQNKVVDGKRVVCSTVNVKTLEQHGGFSSASFIYAVGKAGEEFTSGRGHTKRGKFVINFETGSAASSKVNIPEIVFLHIGCMSLAFLILYPMGVLVAVFSGPGFDKGPQHFTRHKAIMAFATLFAWAGVIAIMIYRRGKLDDMHGIIGAIVIFLCTAQPINAMFRTSKGHPYRSKWELVHKGFGRLAVLGGFGTCILGALLFTEKNFATDDVGTCMLLVALGSLSLAFSSWLVFWVLQRKREKRSKAVAKRAPDDNDAEAEKKNQEPKQEIVKKHDNRIKRPKTNDVKSKIDKSKPKIKLGSTKKKTKPEEGRE